MARLLARAARRPVRAAGFLVRAVRPFAAFSGEIRTAASFSGEIWTLGGS